jgi:hypothetical protein
VVTVPLKVPWNRTCELLLVTLIVPPVNEKQLDPQFATKVPVVTLTVPKLPVVRTPFLSIEVNTEVSVNDPPAVADPVRLAVVPSVPAFPKSTVVARAAVGSANANNANKTTRRILLLHLSSCFSWGKLVVGTFMASELAWFPSFTARTTRST